MAYFLAVANRKGGVGKSTISVMLAYAFSVWSGKKVLLVDLDAQSNSSLILLGGDRWIETQRKSKNVAAYIEDRMYSVEQSRMQDYLVQQVGDVISNQGEAPNLALLPGSLNFEEMQDILITNYSMTQKRYESAKRACAQHFASAFGRAKSLADIVIFDCAPGLSNATAAALKLANKVVVPFRPDAVSEFAVDRISQIVEGRKFDEVLSIPGAERRYVCLANYVRPGGRDAIYVDTIAGNHPMLNAHMPAMPEVADAFDYLGEPQSLEEKYGAAITPMQAVHAELATLLKI
ncbi:MAG TPA: AAA family ATPase [Hyphomicrobiaceae bacterium]|nr:AAA family ATPase [Hyphomicrobiaceae bacterium]